MQWQDQEFRFPESVRVVVTDEHIRCGTRGARRACPIAKAILEGGTFPVERMRVYVFRRHIEIRHAGDGSLLHTYGIPEHAVKFISSYDLWGQQSADAKAFEFDIRSLGVREGEGVAR